jgi:hypothetical protein
MNNVITHLRIINSGEEYEYNTYRPGSEVAWLLD